MRDISFQLDEHIANGVARALRRRGIDVLTASDAHLQGVPDSEYLLRSRESGRVLATLDSDFVRLHFDRRPHAGIVYFPHRQNNIGHIVECLELIFETLTAAEIEGRLEFM